MAAQQRTGRPNRTVRIVKHAITIGAVALTILGSVALSDERPSAGGNVCRRRA